MWLLYNTESVSMMCGLIETDQWLKKKQLDMVMQQILNYNISLSVLRHKSKPFSYDKQPKDTL